MQFYHLPPLLLLYCCCWYATTSCKASTLQVFVVSPQSSMGNGSASSINTAAGPCWKDDSKRKLCRTIEDALNEILRVRQKRKQPSSAANQAARMTLLAQINDGCHIKLSQSMSKNVQINATLSNLEIVTTEEGSGKCSHSIIQDTHVPVSKPSISVSGSAQVLLRGLRFEADEFSQAIAVRNSSHVVIDRCLFLLRGQWRKTVTVLIEASQYVFLIRSEARRVDQDKIRLKASGFLKSIHPVVKQTGVHIDTYGPQREVINQLRPWLIKVTSGIASGALHHTELYNRHCCSMSRAALGSCASSSSSSSSSCPAAHLGLAIVQCTFTNIGVISALYSQIEKSLHTLKGSAVHLETLQTSNPSLFHIANSAFIRLSGPESAAVFVRFRNTSSSAAPSAAAPRHVLVEGCDFSGNTGLLGGAVTVRYDGMTSNNSISIDNCTFADNSAFDGGGAIFIRFSRRSKHHNCASISKSTFTGNFAGPMWGRKAMPGSAIMAFTSGEQRSAPLSCYPDGGEYPVNIRSSTFANNSGFGSVFSRTTAIGFYGSIYIVNNTGTGVVAMQTRMTFMGGTVLIANNTGNNGGALHVADGGQINFTKVSELTILHNQAKRGGAMYIDGYSSAASYDKLQVYVGKDRYLASCPILLPDNSNATNLHQLASENGNNAEHLSADQVTPAIYSVSWHRCFQAYKIIENVFKHSQERQLVNSTYCWPYPPAGWSNIKNRSSCENNCSVERSDYMSVLPSQGNGFLQQPTVCHSSCQNITVVSGLDVVNHVIRTAPAWLFFRNTSTSCYKQAGEEVWFFRNNCSRDNVFQFASNSRLLSGGGSSHCDRRSDSSFSAIISTQLQRFDCSVFKLATTHERFRTTLMPILPGYPLIMTPWAGIIHSWLDYNLEEFREDDGVGGMTYKQLYNETCTIIEDLVIDSENAVGDLTLYPAPGEQFDLSFDVVDEFMSGVGATLGVKVEADKNDVIMRQDDRDYMPGESLYYSSSGNLTAVSLSGVPGSTGKLLIHVVGRGAVRHTNFDRNFIELWIPFRLRGCLPGFQDPSIGSSKEAAEYITELSEQHDSSAFTSDEESPLVCRCPTNYGIQKCRHGHEIMVRTGFWAGNFSFYQRRDLDNTCVFDKTAFFRNDTALDGDGCNVRGVPWFAIGFCDNGLCYRPSGAAASWSLSSDNPCNPKFNRTGPMCGSCIPEHSILISSVACHDCRNELKISIAVYFLLVFTCSAVLYAVVLCLNIGVSCTLNSWLFFIQAIFIIFSDSVSMQAIFYTTLTFGLGHICVREQLTPLQARAALVLQPFFIFFFSFLLWLAVRHGVCAKRLQHLQKRHSLAHVIWLSVIYWTASLGFIATTLLNSVRLEMIEKDTLHVLFIDGSVEVFGKEHLWFGIMAITILVLLVTPPTLIMAIPYLRSMQQFKWYADHAMKVYEPDRHWWAAVDLGRRLLLACLEASVDHTWIRHYLMAMICVLFLATHLAYRPLKRNKGLGPFKDIDNRIETMLLFDLCVLSVAKTASSCSNLPFMPSLRVVKAINITLYAVPTLICFAVAMVRFVQSMQLTFRKHQPMKRYTVDENDAAMEDHATALKAMGSHTCSSARIGPGNSNSNSSSNFSTSTAATSSSIISGGSSIGSSNTPATPNTPNTPAGDSGGAHPHARSNQGARPKWLLDFDLPVANGLRDPLLIEHLMQEDGEDN